MLSILASKQTPGTPFVPLKKIVEDHWKEYGRNYYCRYDYEDCQGPDRSGPQCVSIWSSTKPTLRSWQRHGFFFGFDVV